MLIADGGGSARVPVNVPNPVNTAQQPASSAESDAAARARELQRQLEALLEKLREMQRQAEEARKRAIEAQRKAAEARKHAEAMEAQAEKTKQLADANKAKKAQQEAKLEDARAKEASAQANLKDKDVTLLNAKVEQKREEKKSPEAKASAATDKKVQDAQTERNDAQETSDFSKLYLDSQEKESKAQDAEAKVARLTPTPGRPSATITEKESKALGDAEKEAKTLRGEADAATKKFASEIGEEANTEFWGPPAPATTAEPAAKATDDPLQTPLTQLLQVSPKPTANPAANNGLLFAPTLTSGYTGLTGNSGTTGTTGNSLLVPPSTLSSGAGTNATSPFTTFLKAPEPVVTPEVKKTLTDIADGKSVEQIASDRKMRVDQVLSEANAAGVKITTAAPKDGMQATTIQRGDASLTYSRNDKQDTLSVKGNIADPKAPGGQKAIDATEDGKGRYSQVTKDAKTGATTTTTIDSSAGTRTVSVVDKHGLRTDTTTSLTGAQVTRPVGDYEGYLEVAKAAGLTPERLLALNPDVDYGKALKPGQELVVAGVPTTIKTFNKDGSTLEKTTASDGMLQVVATSASGRRTVLMGEPDGKNGPGEEARKSIFDDKKSVAETAKATGMTEDEVLAALPEGTVDVRKPSADNGHVETRTIYDPATNRLVVERNDWNHGGGSREDIDDKTKYTVTQKDPETGKSERVEVSGGLGYLQHQAEDKAKYAESYDQQISGLDKTIRLYKRMGEPVTELVEQRKLLVSQQTDARGEATIANTKATAALTKQQQVTIDEQARVAYENLAYARPGSKDQAAAAKALDDRLELLDHVDRLVDVADKDVDLAKAGADHVKNQDAKAQADAELETEFQAWKRTWRWSGLDEKEIQKREAQGALPPGPMYRNAEEENDAAWKAFVQQQEMMDEHGEKYLTDAGRPARNAWLNRNQASDAALDSSIRYDQASIASGGANTHLTKGELDRLQQKKDAWTDANPTVMPEKFKDQEALDKLAKDVADGEIGNLEIGEQKKHSEYLKTVSAPDRADPETLKKAEEKYTEENQEATTRLNGQIKDISERPLREKTRSVDDYIAQWGKRNPETQKELDALGKDQDQRSLRAAEYRSGQIHKLLSASDQGKELQAAINLRYSLTDQWLKIGDKDDDRLEKDLEGIEKGIEGHTWVRDVWGSMAGDSAEDAKNYTEKQRDGLRDLRDDLRAGRISASEYARRENEFMDAYDVESDKMADRVRDSDGTWSVVDDAVRMTVTAAAGIAATIASGGNVGLGFGVAMIVSEAWDTTGDIVAAAQGRDIYADGHTSLRTLANKVATGNWSWDDVKFTLKEEAIDVATNAVTATGVGAGIKTSASVSAKLLANGTMVGSKGALHLGGRAVVGARAGVTSQAVDGTGRVAVEIGRVGLDGKLGTEEGDKRIGATFVSSAAGLVTAPITGGVSGAIPLWKAVSPAAQAQAQASGVAAKQQLTYVGLGAQFGNDGAAGLGTGDLISLVNEGRHMNRGEFIAASLQVIPGTLNNVALHPAMAARARAQAEAAQNAAPARTLHDELVVNGLAMPHLANEDSLVPAQVSEAMAPGGRVELHVAADRPDGPMPRNGEAADIDPDQATAIHERLRSAGFDQIRIERNPDAEAGAPGFIVHAVKEGGEIQTDGVVPLLSRTVPTEPEGQDQSNMADALDGSNGVDGPNNNNGSDYALPPPGSSLHTVSWAGTLRSILQSGGTLRNTAFYLHATPYDENTGLALNAGKRGLPRAVDGETSAERSAAYAGADSPEALAALPPARYTTLKEAMDAAQAGNADRGHDNIALVYEPKLGADGGVPPEAVLATVHIDKTGDAPATLRDVSPNPHSNIAETVALRVSYPVVQAATRAASGLILPGSAARDNFLHVPDDATVYYMDKSKRVTQISANDPRVAQALERAQQARARLLRLPSHEQGLDLDSVQAWREQSGMKPVDLRVVRPGELRKGQGIYHRRDGVALVLRDPAIESRHGTAPTLRTAAHELAHGNENQRNVFVLRDHQDADTLRPTFVIEPMSGFLRFDPAQKRTTGLAFEEAYAEHKARQFDEARFGPKDGDESFDGQLGRYRLQDGEHLDHGAYTAVTLDAILRMNPGIGALMERARFSSAAREQLISVLGEKLDAFYAYRGEDLSTRSHQDWAEQLYDAVRHNRPMPAATGEGPVSDGPVALNSRPVQRAASAGDDGLPLKPSAFGTDGDWMAAALHLEDTIAQQHEAGQPGKLPAGMILSDTDKAVTQALMKNPAPGSQECFVVSTRPPSKGIFSGDDVRAKRKEVFDTIEKVQQAVSKRNGGAWVYRVAPEGGIGEMTRVGKARSHNIVGAFYVGNDKSVFPVGIANPQFDRWDLTAAAPAGHPHVYNAALTMPVGRPAEGIFRQGGIEEGADAATAAIARAVAEGRAPRVMIAAGYTIENGRAETSGPGGAAVAGKAARLYSSQLHGVDAQVTYVAAGRRQRKVLEAALEALGERKGEHYEIVSFNARGKLAEWRSAILLRRHQPDLLMGFDVPGRTEKGEYHNSHGQAVGYHTAARDQLFIDATRNDRITTVAGFDLGNEVGGGHPDVHTRVQPAPNGTPIASIVTADVAMTGGRTNWVGYAFGTEVLRRAGALSAVPDERAIRSMVMDMMKAGGVDSETRSRVPFSTDSRGRTSGVGGMSPDVEAAVAAMLRVRAEKIQMAPAIDLRGVRLRLGVFDSGSGGIIAAAEIKRVVEETTGARVDLVMVGDHGAGTYGPKSKTEIADHTRAGLETLDKLGVDLIVMACNTACTSGKGEYARGINAPVIDLIDSTRSFHKGLVGQGERVVAFSTEASATLPLPGTDLIGVYRDKDVLPVGGTDDGFDVASIVNQYMADPMNADMRARMQGAADHYADKILAAKPDVTTVSWCCTHYPELEPFFTKSLQDRGRSDVKMINPMAHQAMRAIEVAEHLPPGTGTGPSRAIGITTAVADKAEAIRTGTDPGKATVQQSEVLQTLRIALQREDVTLVPLKELGEDVDVAQAQRLLDQDEAGDPIDALQAFDPSGRGFPIHVPGGAYAAAKMLGDAGKVAVVAGFPIRTAAGRVAPESDSTKGAAVLAAGLAKLGKDTVCITIPANVKPLKAALAVLGRGDIDVRSFGLKIGPHAEGEALRMLQRLNPDAIISVEAPGRDAKGQYWSSTGEPVTGHVAALDEFFYAARTINEGRSGDAKIKQLAILDVGNEVGGGNVDKRVRRAPDGQRIASEVTVDQLVTAGVGSWGADATLAALEVHHNRSDLLPSADEVRRVMRAITREGGVDSQSRTGIDHAAGYDSTVHVGVAELYRQAALEVKADGGPNNDGPDAGGVAPPKGGAPKPGGPRPAEPLSAAFRGDEWPAVHAKLISGGFGNENIYVYRVKGQPDLYADPAKAVDLTAQQISGAGRVAQGTSTVRWYGNSTPGQGVGGLMPRREMGAKFGLEPKGDKERVYRIKNRETTDITFQTEKPTAEQRADPNLLIRSRKVRPPREATPLPVEDWFIVSNQSPTRTNAANGLRNVTRGNDDFKLGVVEKTYGPATGWGTGKVIKRQITLGLVAAVGISGLNMVSPIDTGHDVPSGVVGLPRNPIASATQHTNDAPGFRATPEAFSVPAEVTLGMAWHQQRQADQLARQPGADPASAKALQSTADSHWGAFSAEMLKTIRNDVQQGANPVAAANRQRAQLLSVGRLDVHSDNAVRGALRDSGLLKGTTADVQEQMDYAKLVADHPAFVNDKGRELARTDPAAFAAASLIAIGPDGAAFNTAVQNNAAMLGRLHSEAVVTELLADGDLAGAAREARLRLDVSATPAERDKAAAALLPLFEPERTRALDMLAGMQMQDVGDYLAQYRDAPPEIAQPMAQGALELLQKNLPRPSDDLSSMSQFDRLVEGLSILAEAADARTPTSAFSEKFATELMKDRFVDRPEFVVTLQRGVEGAVVQGSAKLPVELANALEKQDRGDMRDSVLAGIDKGLQAQDKHLGEAIGNLRGTAGYNAVGASMAFYVANFSDGTPQGVATAIAQYRRVNPELAGKIDGATRVIGDWGSTLHQTQESLNGLRVGTKGSEAEQGLEGTVGKVYDSEDVKLAISQSPQVRQELLSRATQGVPDPRTMTEYLINPVMFVTRHVSGTTRMVWSMLADAQFNGMVNEPVRFAARWDAFKLKTERMANVLGLNANEVRQGTALVDKYVGLVKTVDSGLSDAARINEYARLGSELDGELQKLLGVGAKTINNATNANTAFGQALRWVANAGFVTHNVSTEITNFRPMADGVQDYTQWYHRIYAPTQAFFMAKPYTTLMAERSLAGNRVIDGAAADIEGKMAWKYVFGLGTAGVGAADLSLAFGQKDTVPAWVTYTNVGMGVGGLVDGGVGLVNVTGAALTRAGAVELGALLAIPAEVATIGGIAVAVFTGIKQFYNIAHHYDQVDAREMQRDPALRDVLKDRGFSDAQTRAMLDCTHEGVSPMVAWNALMKSEGKTVDEGMQLLRDRLAKDGPQGIPAAEWTKVMHGLTDRKMNDNDGSFPANDPDSAQAGQIVIREVPTRAGTGTSKSTVMPQSIEGLENYARETWNLRL